MNLRTMIIIFCLLGAAGNYIYKYFSTNHPEKTLGLTYSEKPQYVKCTAKDGSIYYGEVPKGVTCEKSEALNINIKSSSKVSHQNTQSQTPKNSARFKCDGREYCSQMTSCAEATFFYNNCPNVKMSGDGDNIPCERQWCG